MAKTILYEAHNLTLTRGTGIATYARNLSETAKKLGYEANALVGVNAKIDKRDPVLAEIQLFDTPKSRPWVSHPRLAIDLAIGSPLGITPSRLPSQGVVIQPGPNQFSTFDETLSAPFLFDRAEWHFQRWGRFASVNLAQPPALFHLTHPTPLKVEGCPNIATIHDIVPLRLPYTTLDDKRLMLKMLRKMCHESDHIVTVSEFSRRDIMSFFDVPESRITNTYQSVSIPERLTARSEDEVAADLRHGYELEPREYFLFFGAIEPKKNVARMVEAFAASGSKYPLVIVGALGWQYDSDVELIEDERFTQFRINGDVIAKKKRVRRLPYVPFGQLVSLIRGARAVLFPSIYEGFGLPVLEAMLLGAPVITSNSSSLPEIAGEAALLVDPWDAQSIADGIRRIDADADLRSELSMRGRRRAEFFSPEKYAERIEALYNQILN